MRRVLPGVSWIPTWASRLAAVAASAAGLLAAESPKESAALRLIGVQTLPGGMTFRDTVVGGLSGLDYDARSGTWIAISDDRSEHGAARFYRLELNYHERSFSSVVVRDVVFLREPGGGFYLPKTDAIQPGDAVADFEAVRLDPRDDGVWYASEGDRGRGVAPFVRRCTADGRFAEELPLPPLLRLGANPAEGPRDNLSFEGLTFDPAGETLWLAMEAPLLQDGPLPTTDAGAMARISHFDRAGKMLGQLVCPIDPTPLTAAPGKLAGSGIAEILALDERRLLVLERAGAQDGAGKFHFDVRLSELEVEGATDVSDFTTLRGAPYQAAMKRRLLALAELKESWVDNLEGMAWGPRLANGHRTLVMVSDDNFSAEQQTQFWVFEYVPPVEERQRRSWDEPFDGVVQSSEAIRGFVGEYRWLSNFLPCRVTWEGRSYGSSEAAYQSAKYPAEEREVFTFLDPENAKKLARRKPFDAAAWEARKERCMREIVRAKFSQNPELAARLRATGTRVLEETNWWGDRFWGVSGGEGKNVFGRILMETRARLASEVRP